jgi:putative RNA 2'-phosphotransferase
MNTRPPKTPYERWSRKLSWLLRHGAADEGLAMDTAGWAAIADVRALLRINDTQLEGAIRHNDKNRIEVDGDRIRACQGHSLETMPVTREALEASWRRWEGTDLVWHGTRVSAVEGIVGEGIHAGRRSHVHLAASLDSIVGKRSNTPVMLGVDPERLANAGIGLYVSPNGVMLCRHVPTDAIVSLVPKSKRSRAEAPRLRQLLGIAADA